MSDGQTGQVRVGVLGCGNIAGPYVDDLKGRKEVRLVGVADIVQDKAETFASEHGVTALPSVDALIHHPDIDLIVNLTAHHAHQDVTAQCLNAGKHVYSEKPLAMTAIGAQNLVQLAKDKGLRLGCSPFTLIGSAQQSAWKSIREGKLGQVRVVYAEVNWARIESWHPAPQGFYEVGPLYDVGVYPLTVLAAICGPARHVTAFGRVVMPDRLTKEGEAFTISTPDFIVTMIEHESGTITRLTTNFYVGHHNKQAGIEFHGDAGSLYLQSWLMPNATLEYADFGDEYAALPLVTEPEQTLRWGTGVVEMARAIQADKPHRFTGELAAHVTEILEAATHSMQSGERVAVHSSFTPPRPRTSAL